MKPISRLRKSSFVTVLLPLLLLQACASTQFSAGEQKNSMPLMEKDMLENVHSIVVAPFFGDGDNWGRLAGETLSVRSLSLIRAGDADLSTLGPYNRREALVKLGRSLRADAVLNGILLSKDNRSEIIIQLISTKDSRVIFWQAVDFSHKEGPIDPAAQRELLSKILEPIADNVAKKEALPAALAPQQPKAGGPSVPITRPNAGARSKPNIPPPMEKRPKADKNDRDRERIPAPPPEDISPM